MKQEDDVHTVPPMSPDPAIRDQTIQPFEHEESLLQYRHMTKDDVYNLSINMLSYIESNMKMHAEAATTFSRKQCFLFIPTIILSSICTILNVLLSILSEDETYRLLEIVIGVLTVITGTLVTLSNSFKYPRIEAQHRNTAELYDSIRTKLTIHSMDYNPRFNYDQFFSEIRNQIEDNKSRCKVLLPTTIEDTISNEAFVIFEKKLSDQLKKRACIEEHRNKVREIEVSVVSSERERLARDLENFNEHST